MRFKGLGCVPEGAEGLFCGAVITRGAARLLHRRRSRSVWWYLINAAPTAHKVTDSALRKGSRWGPACAALGWRQLEAELEAGGWSQRHDPSWLLRGNACVHPVLHHGNFTPLGGCQGSSSRAGAEGTLTDRHPWPCTFWHDSATK